MVTMAVDQVICHGVPGAQGLARFVVLGHTQALVDDFGEIIYALYQNSGSVPTWFEMLVNLPSR